MINSDEKLPVSESVQAKASFVISLKCGCEFFSSKKGVGSSVLAPCSTRCNSRVLFVPRDQGNATQGSCALPCLPQGRCSQTLYHSRKLLNLVDNLKGTCIKWHLENKTQSKSNQLMKQDVIRSTDNKIRPFFKSEACLFLLLDKTENLLLQLMVMRRRTIAISVARFCNRTD